MSRKKTNVLSRLSEYGSLFTIACSLVVGGLGAYISSKIEKNNMDHQIENLDTRMKATELIYQQVDADKTSIILLKKEMLDLQNDMAHVKNEMLKEVTARLNNIEKQIAGMTAILERMERKVSPGN